MMVCPCLHIQSTSTTAIISHPAQIQNEWCGTVHKHYIDPVGWPTGSLSASFFKNCPPRGSVMVSTLPHRSDRVRTPPLRSIRVRTPPRGSVKVSTLPHGSDRVRIPPLGSISVGTPPRGSDRVRNTGDCQFSKKCPPHGSVRDRTPPRGSVYPHPKMNERQTDRQTNSSDRITPPWQSNDCSNDTC